MKYLQEKRNRERSHKTPHIAVSHVVSGTGLATAYECLSGLFPELASKSVREKFDSERDFKGRVVGEHFSDCPICKRAVEAVVRYVGSMVFISLIELSTRATHVFREEMCAFCLESFTHSLTPMYVCVYIF